MRRLAAADAGSRKMCSPDTGQEKLGVSQRAHGQPTETPSVPQGPLFNFQYRQTTEQMNLLDANYLKIQLCGHAIAPIDKDKILPCVHYFE